MNNQTGIIIGDKNPTWIDKSKNIESKFQNQDFAKIINFFLLQTPVTELSVRSKSVDSFGWGNTYELKKKMRIIGTNKINFEFADRLNEMQGYLTECNLIDDFSKISDYTERGCFYIVKNQLNSIFYHIRNSLAHGRFNIIEQNNDWIFIMEDINLHKKVSARMILRKSTLLDWIAIIKQGNSQNEKK